MNITKGKQIAPVKAVIYGPEGVGKSTFAAAWPAPVFLDIEGGTKQLDVERLDPVGTGDEIRKAIASLTTEAHDFRTVVIDTADWMEKRIIDDICRKAKVDGIDGFVYGKGYTVLADAISGILNSLNALQTKRGMHIVFLAHATIKRCDPPTESGQPYDRYELKCTRQVSPLLKEWSDLLLFLNFRTMVQAGESGKAKGMGGRERVMHTTHHAAYDAKNRFGLADELPVDVASLAAVFAAPQATTTAKPSEPIAPPLTNLDAVEEAARAAGVDEAKAIAWMKARGVSVGDATRFAGLPAETLERMAKAEAMKKWLDGAMNS